MGIPANPTIYATPTLVSGLLNQIPFNEGFIWPLLVKKETTTGKKWESRSSQTRALMAKLLDLSEKLPFLMKGLMDMREGGFIKLGGALPIDPEELMGLDKTGEISPELVRITNSLRISIDSALEWIVLRGLSGQAITLESGISANLGAVGATPTVGTIWSNIAAPGIADLMAAIATFKGLAVNQNQAPSAILMSSQDFLWLRNQTATQAMIFGTASAGQIVSDAQLRELLNRMSIPQIITYDSTVEVESGITFVATRVLPIDRVVLLPPKRVFPNGYGRVFFTRSSDQIVNANEGLIDPGLSSENPYYGWVEKQTNPGRYEVNGLAAVGIDLEGTASVVVIDTTP